jgi:hypothetical protein
VGISISYNKMDILIRIEECEREYKTINNFKGLITFQWFLSYKNPSWSKKKIAGGLKEIEEIRAAFGWNTTPTRREKQRNPTPSRSTQLCYSCKVPWEPDHRCRGKGKKHIVEVREDSDDEACEDGSIEAYQSSLMMIVTLAQRLVIVTLPQRIVMMTLAQRLVVLACLRRRMALV